MPLAILLTPNIQRALRFIWHSGRGLTVASIGITVLQGVLPLAGLYLMKLLVDAAVVGLAATDKVAAFESLAILIAGLTGIVLLEAACTSIARLMTSAHGQIITDNLADVLHSKSVELDLEYFESPQYYDSLRRAQQEASHRPTQLLNGLTQLLHNTISLVAIGGLLLWLHWGVLILLLAVGIPGALVRLRYSKKLHAWQRQQTPKERRAWYFAWILTRDSHAKEIRLFNLGQLFMNRFRELRSQLLRERLTMMTQRTVAELVALSGATIAVFGLFALLAYRTVNGLTTLGDLVMYYQAIQRGQGYFRQILNGFADLYENNLFLTNLYEFLDLKPRLLDPVCPSPVPRPIREGIVFQNVSFHYPTDSKQVFKQVNLTIRPGEHVALVGENGAGKTTLIKLLCRLYDPTEGRITIDGVDLRQCQMTDLRNEISVIFQDYARYHLTARENIWLGNINCPSDKDTITDAARHAGIDGAISKLSNGYETVLGKWFHGGKELSVGEWQKVALARAFLRNSQIIVLDEPTSAMDATAEYEIFQNFHELAKGRTAILISHRLSTVRMVDRIYVMEHGNIAESGSHDELLWRGGIYADLFEIQSRNYR